MKKRLKLKKNVKKGLITILLLLALYSVITVVLFAASDYIRNIEITEKR